MTRVGRQSGLGAESPLSLTPTNATTPQFHLNCQQLAVPNVAVPDVVVPLCRRQSVRQQGTRMNSVVPQAVLQQHRSYSHVRGIYLHDELVVRVRSRQDRRCGECLLEPDKRPLCLWTSLKTDLQGGESVKWCSH